MDAKNIGQNKRCPRRDGKVTRGAKLLIIIDEPLYALLYPDWARVDRAGAVFEGARFCCRGSG
jgi:hypothetical protein